MFEGVGLKIGATLAAMLVAALVVNAQGPAEPSQGSVAERTSPGDLQGIWQAMNSAAWDLQDHPRKRFPGFRRGSACRPGKASSRETRSRISQRALAIKKRTSKSA